MISVCAETQTYEIIEDVAHMKSEIGILFLNDFNEIVNKKAPQITRTGSFRSFLLPNHMLFISVDHPLAHNDVITNEQLEDYPYLSFEQGEHNSFISQKKYSLRLNGAKISVYATGQLFQPAHRFKWLHRMQWCNR